MDIDLTGKQAIICGASKGIGRAAARELALLGASVTIVARNAEALEAVKAQLDVSKGQIHHILPADFSAPDTLEAAISAHIKRLF